jgi:hypothetical protein
MWMYSPQDKQFWHARLAGHQIYVEQTSWFEAGGVERTEGGFNRWSKRYRELTLTGPHSIGNLHIAIKNRDAYSRATYNWPAGRLASFVPAK